jgi:hypothetical protein
MCWEFYEVVQRNVSSLMNSPKELIYSSFSIDIFRWQITNKRVDLLPRNCHKLAWLLHFEGPPSFSKSSHRCDTVLFRINMCNLKKSTTVVP